MERLHFCISILIARRPDPGRPRRRRPLLFLALSLLFFPLIPPQTDLCRVWTPPRRAAAPAAPAAPLQTGSYMATGTHNQWPRPSASPLSEDPDGSLSVLMKRLLSLLPSPEPTQPSTCAHSRLLHHLLRPGTCTSMLMLAGWRARGHTHRVCVRGPVLSKARKTKHKNCGNCT